MNTDFARNAVLTLVSCTLICTAAIARAAAPDDYPTKPVRLVVPFPPGASSDVVGRMIGQKLSEQLGQQVIADNRPGAGGNLGIGGVLFAPAFPATIPCPSDDEFAIQAGECPLLPTFVPHRSAAAGRAMRLLSQLVQTRPRDRAGHPLPQPMARLLDFWSPARDLLFQTLHLLTVNSYNHLDVHHALHGIPGFPNPFGYFSPMEGIFCALLRATLYRMHPMGCVPHFVTGTRCAMMRLRRSRRNFDQTGEPEEAWSWKTG